MQNQGKNRVMTRIVVPLAKAICKVWKRYENWRYENNFDFYVEDVSKSFTNSLAYHEQFSSKGFFQKHIEQLEFETLYCYRFGSLQITISRGLPYWGELIWDKRRVEFVTSLIERASRGQFSSPNKRTDDEQRKTTG